MTAPVPTKETLLELLDLLEYRKERFGLVADAFAQETPPDQLKAILDEASKADDIDDGSPEAELAASLRDLQFDDFDTFATKTRTEYARMFIGPRKVLVPLHESAYRSGVSRMFTNETLNVRKFYEHFGYVMLRKNKEPEDSVGVEFEFLRNLCQRCVDILDAEVDEAAMARVRKLLGAQGQFKEQHLGIWAQRFVEGVVDTDQSGYYRAWAQYLSRVLEEDEQLLAECGQLADGGNPSLLSAVPAARAAVD